MVMDKLYLILTTSWRNLLRPLSRLQPSASVSPQSGSQPQSSRGVDRDKMQPAASHHQLATFKCQAGYVQYEVEVHHIQHCISKLCA